VISFGTAVLLGFYLHGRALMGLIPNPHPNLMIGVAPPRKKEVGAGLGVGKTSDVDWSINECRLLKIEAP
jgi:hypothetical protein